MSTLDANAYTRSWSSREASFVTLSDGAKLRYLEIGRGPPLVLIHTVRTQLDLFQHLIPLLTQRYTVYAVDLPGFGWSDIVPCASYTEPALRARLVEFIRKLGLVDVTLAGESIGAVLALTLATSPDLTVRRVLAFNTYDYLPGLERANLLASIIIKSVRAPVIGPLFAAMENRMILKGIISGGFADPAHLPASFIDELSKSGSRPGYSKVARAVYRALPSFVAARELYDQVKVPVSLVYGDQDWSTPKERDANRDILRPEVFKILPATGHFAAMENPTACAPIFP
ncbi:MAG: alpha/beta hydrolase [Sphingomonadales bacterium]|nr:alpha/beta hydrolase [Sphingomonadales bacterium]MDE2172012.1 alpha/beta hydrolase [Sphingomonadales bacterium]